MLKKYIYIFLFPLFIKAQTYPAKPVNYVTDEAGILDEQQQAALNNKLKRFEDSTSNQLFVYLTQSLNGNDISQYTQDIFHNWQIGAKGKNNGVLVAIYVKDHKFRIHTGYGLEGALPDLLTKRIQDNTMRPYFKQNDYYTGIDKGVDELIYYCGHEFKEDDLADGDVITDPAGWVIVYVINGSLLLLFLYQLFGKKAKQRGVAGKVLWVLFGILLALIPVIGAIIIFLLCGYLGGWKGWRGGGSGSSYSSYDSGSSWSSSDSSSSSDFSGGGGGDSGGGGSSSDW